MQRYLLRISTALLAFGLGIGTTMLWVDYRTPTPITRDFACQTKWQITLPQATISKADAPPPGKLIRVGVLQGKAISRPQPRYPPLAKEAGVSGTVIVEIIVDETGRVSSAQAVSGHPLLREAAVQAATQARFSPTLLSGQPVKVSSAISYNFVLQ